MDITIANKVLNDFNKLPKSYIETTFLEICRYPRRRFEEICSRVLSFSTFGDNVTI
jgi:hypothetical protein